MLCSSAEDSCCCATVRVLSIRLNTVLHHLKNSP
ncbi:hypothetical protein KKJ06_06405 [Xenorhabdus bovienii]|nr:hypothetical protein [Xenorhabdus bovienii]MDE9550136.1 hypothetical protein [Xenorhabdus bovienii]MDE9555079.1 hypothetical protein [Xenorhabdus bovienii]MDE9564583.1 hypothetical protein [Xenorhabdus bovienii]